jgi:hypothetical protein
MPSAKDRLATRRGKGTRILLSLQQAELRRMAAAALEVEADVRKSTRKLKTARRGVSKKG